MTDLFAKLVECCKDATLSGWNPHPIGPLPQLVFRLGGA